MAEYIGNTSNIINWQSIVDSLHDSEPAYIGPRHSGNDDIIGIKEMAKLWDDAGFVLLKDGGTAGWDMFFPEKHFDKSIVDIFANFVNVDPIDCWISRIRPGNMTPWHWDCNDKEDYYSKLNTARFTCHISKPSNGHISLVEGDCLYLQEQGNVYKWPARTSWHGGINIGLTDKYLFNFFGVIK